MDIFVAKQLETFDELDDIFKVAAHEVFREEKFSRENQYILIYLYKYLFLKECQTEILRAMEVELLDLYSDGGVNSAF
jgi:hypothetical protein